nr:protein SCAR3 isoform X3 [Ipomoea batatas]
MPLVRVGVRNEFSLGATELYREADKEDPKAVLDGVAVSGLVGILRQLGDLAEFAAEVFHGLQEQVTITSSRSHKLMARVQRIETALPSLEKSILAQQSHLHFAYTTGSNWHTRIHCEENHFIYSDLPRFIMDSYEECHGPPRLHLLDKFDAGGPGSCLKRYSDPTFFKRASAGSDEAYLEKVLKDKKGRKIKVTCEDTFHLNTSECNAHLESPQVSKGTVEPVLAHGNLNENGDVLDSTDVESVSKLSSSVSRENGAGVINKVTCPEPPKPPPEPSGVPSVKFWTNGGLLGLQPSKPPDSVLKAVSQVSTTTQDDTIGTPRQNTDPVDEKHARTCVTENGRKNREESQHSMRYHDNQDGGVFVTKTSSRYSSVDLDARVEKSNHSCHQNSINSPPDSHFNESDTVPSGTVLPVAPDSLRTSTGQENVNNSSRILSLGNRLLVNGFQRKLSLGWENNSNSASSMTSGLSEQKNHCENVTARTFSQKTTDLYGTGSPIMSPSWSPPLGHMKISFQPVDGFETHKLKLRFPDRGTRQESGSDMFPSFQLVPDADIPLHDMSSDSDNDTFCRSSPYASDDCLSHQSESNSEQWESGESSSTKDHEVYDALRRISLTESTSTSFDNRLTTQEELYDSVGGQIPFSEHGFERSPSAYFYDLPILDTLRPPVKQESGNCSTSTALLERHSPKEPTPPPPSVPPQRWQPMRSLSDMTDGREGSLPKGLNYTVDKKLQAATFLHQPKPAPLNQDQVIEPAFGLKSKRLDLQQIDLQRVASLPANGKEMEEKEDFLHQIRTKSFNLRPTVTARPTQATGLPTSVNAILEKANAIRQVVGSDGEDDNWSDT